MRILLVIGSQILSQGLQNLLNSLLTEAIFADQFTAPEDFAPDVVLFDSQENARELKSLYPEAKFVCLDMGLSDSEVACLIFCHGVNGILPPQGDSHMLCKALRVIHRGEYWLGQQYLKKAIEQQPNANGQKHLQEFSGQDKRIISMIVVGRKNREIADVLCLSESTVKSHVSRIYRSLHVKNRAQLARLASLNIYLASGISSPAE